ncbi:MAG: NnrS family protein [Pseudomonadales bacterium]
MQLIDLNKEERILPLFRLAFRPFFLFAALFSIIALLLWGQFWLGGLSFSPYGNWLWWHGHEMLFGFVSAVITGFLLTAVQNWTGRLGLRGFPLLTLVVTWLLARVLLLFPGPFPEWLIAVIDLSFLPMVAAVLGFYVVRARLWRNILFVPVLLGMTVLNGFMHWAAISGDILLYKKLAATVVFLIAFLISLMGGRVIPFFTANGTGTEKASPIKWLEIGALASILLLALGTLLGFNAGVMGAICLLAFALHAVRTFRWRIWITFRVPLLWSLHIACWFLALGFLQLSLFYWGVVDDYITILHTLTVGGIGLIILAMIARISLGHTGRSLQISPWVAVGFAALIAATLLRAGLPMVSEKVSLSLSYGGSIAMWVLGFGIFVFCYLPILTKPRVDGRPG